jgi:hypothetical protein
MSASPGGGLFTIPGSRPFGGQITPLDSDSRSPSCALPVVSPERGVPSGGQSRLGDGRIGPSFCPYEGGAEIVARIAAAIATFFKLCMVIFPI